MEIQNVINKIRLLCSRTVENGCSEAEAFNSAAKIGELMKVYNLSMDKVFLGAQNCVDLAIPTTHKRRAPIDGCLVAIAKFCDCRVWFQRRYDAPSEYHFFGLESDTEMARYLYNLIDMAMESELATFKQSAAYTREFDDYGNQWPRKTLSVSFQKGMASRIHWRLEKMADDRHAEETIASKIPVNGTDIVLLKRDKVEDELNKLGKKLGKAPTQINRNIHSSAYRAGGDAGSKVNLNRPIDGVKQRMLA